MKLTRIIVVEAFQISNYIAFVVILIKINITKFAK